MTFIMAKLALRTIRPNRSDVRDYLITRTVTEVEEYLAASIKAGDELCAKYAREFLRDLWADLGA